MSKPDSHKVEAALVFRVTSGHSGRVYYVDPTRPEVWCTCDAGTKGIHCSHKRAVEAHAVALKALEGK